MSQNILKGHNLRSKGFRVILMILNESSTTLKPKNQLWVRKTEEYRIYGLQKIPKMCNAPRARICPKNIQKSYTYHKNFYTNLQHPRHLHNEIQARALAYWVSENWGLSCNVTRARARARICPKKIQKSYIYHKNFYTNLQHPRHLHNEIQAKATGVFPDFIGLKRPILR